LPRHSLLSRFHRLPMQSLFRCAAPRRCSNFNAMLQVGRNRIRAASVNERSDWLRLCPATTAQLPSRLIINMALITAPSQPARYRGDTGFSAFRGQWYW
jgi:hypothetical protein